MHTSTKNGVGHTILDRWYPTEICATRICVGHYTELVMSYKLAHQGSRNSESA